MKNDLEVLRLSLVEEEKLHRAYEMVYVVNGETHAATVSIVKTSVGKVVRLPESFWKRIQLNGVLAERLNLMLRKIDDGEKIDFPIVLGNLDEIYQAR